MFRNHSSSRRRPRGCAYIAIATAIVAAGTTGAAVPAHATNPHAVRLVGTGTAVPTGHATSITANPDGSFEVIGFPVSGTIHLNGDDVTVDGDYTAIENGTFQPPPFAGGAFTTHGTRRYMLTTSSEQAAKRSLICEGTETGTGPNIAGGADFIEQLRCEHEVALVLHVSETTPHLVNGQLAFNLSITANLSRTRDRRP